MYHDRTTVDDHWQECRGELPTLPESLRLRSFNVVGQTESVVDVDLRDDDLWLRMQLLWPEQSMDGKVVEAIGFVVEELEKGPGPVQLIVAPASWNPFAEIVVFRPFFEGISPNYRVISLSGWEELLFRPPYSLNWSPSPRRRRQKPVHLIFDSREIASPTEPTPWDLMLYVTHRVRECLPAIERI